MSRFSFVSQNFRSSQVDPDLEKEPYIAHETDTKPTELLSNLERFRLMVGITTAPSMQIHPIKSSTGSRVLNTVVGNVQQNKHGSVGMTGQTERGSAFHSPMAAVPPANLAPAPQEAIDNRSSAQSDNMTSIAGLKREADIVHGPRRAAENRGIYVTVVKKAQMASRMYKVTAITINLCLGLQIVVAAALTALGAAGDVKGGGVTVLGAINTVIAGFLTYLKGTGLCWIKATQTSLFVTCLPGKEKYFQHEWVKLRDYIEARERDLRCNDNAFNIYDQVDYIRYMFDSVKKDIETNRSDRFISTGSLQTAPDTNDVQTTQQMQKKKLVELGKTMMSEIKEAAQDVKDAHAEKKKELNHGDAVHHFSLNEAVRALSAEADELKKAVHQEDNLEHFFERILRNRGEAKNKGKRKDENKQL